MGLQHLGYNYDPEYIVSDLSIEVYNLWNNPVLIDEWDLQYLADFLYEDMDLNSIVEDCRYRDHVAKVTKKIDIALTIRSFIGFRCAVHVRNFLCK